MSKGSSYSKDPELKIRRPGLTLYSTHKAPAQFLTRLELVRIDNVSKVPAEWQLFSELVVGKDQTTP